MASDFMFRPLKYFAWLVWVVGGAAFWYYLAHKTTWRCPVITDSCDVTDQVEVVRYSSFAVMGTMLVAVLPVWGCCVLIASTWLDNKLRNRMA
jgi:hypothetical protein